MLSGNTHERQPNFRHGKKKTRRLQRRSLRLPTRSKSAQTGHLCTTAQAGADPGISYVGQNFLVLKWEGGLD